MLARPATAPPRRSLYRQNGTVSRARIELAGIDPNRPGSKGVAEAVGVDLAHPRPSGRDGLKDAHTALVEEDIAKLNRDELA